MINSLPTLLYRNRQDNLGRSLEVAAPIFTPHIRNDFANLPCLVSVGVNGTVQPFLLFSFVHEMTYGG